MHWSYVKQLIDNLNLFDAEKVADDKQRSYTMTSDLLGIEEKHVSKAKTFTDKDMRKVLTYIATTRHAARNRAIVLTTHYAGLRVGETAALRIGDVLAEDGTIKEEMVLTAEQTKGKHARTVYLGEKLRKELLDYLAGIDCSDLTRTLFATQKKRDGFSANTLAQHLFWLYKRAGLTGASSHSGRRTFITNLASKGVGVRVLMSLAGHRNIGTTQAYIDVNDDMLRSAVALI
jgi:integrase/recombinase XerD